jgi:hypothetical protein
MWFSTTLFRLERRVFSVQNTRTSAVVKQTGGKKPLHALLNSRFGP